MPSIYVFKRKKAGKASKFYTAQIRIGNEKGRATYLRSTGATDRREAEAVARRLMREIIEDLKSPQPEPEKEDDHLTLADMFSNWIMERGHELRSGKDIKWQVSLILELIGGNRKARDIGNKEVSAFVRDAKVRGYGPVPINRCLSRIRATMNYAALRWEEPIKVISWMKMMEDEVEARDVYLSPDEARSLMKLLPSHIALAFAFTLYTGCRLDELETLTWDRVDRNRSAAIVITKGRGTRERKRTVWLSQKAIAILIECAAQQGEDPAGPVFDLTNRRKHWEKARAAIGRKDVTWHDLRGMTATWSRQYAKADIRLISATLGHSDTKVTERYARVIDQEIVAMLDQLPDVSPQTS
jgi:integrase